MQTTNFQKVKQFTEESSGTECPSVPRSLTFNEAKFITKMVISEMFELLETFDDKHSTAEMVHHLVDEIVREEPLHSIPTGEIAKSAQQFDALVDCCYYIYNCCAKKGLDYDSFFNIVHEANMAKKFPDGEFHRRKDGKVIKPDSWAPPDTEREMARQMGS